MRLVLFLWQLLSADTDSYGRHLLNKGELWRQNTQFNHISLLFILNHVLLERWSVNTSCMCPFHHEAPHQSLSPHNRFKSHHRNRRFALGRTLKEPLIRKTENTGQHSTIQNKNVWNRTRLYWKEIEK
jgi:hypothetical protein